MKKISLVAMILLISSEVMPRSGFGGGFATGAILGTGITLAATSGSRHSDNQYSYEERRANKASSEINKQIREENQQIAKINKKIRMLEKDIDRSKKGKYSNKSKKNKHSNKSKKSDDEKTEVLDNNVDDKIKELKQEIDEYYEDIDDHKENIKELKEELRSIY